MEPVWCPLSLSFTVNNTKKQKSNWNPTYLLGLIHSDVCGPTSLISCEGFRYFITVTSDLSGYEYLLNETNMNEVQKPTG